MFSPTFLQPAVFTVIIFKMCLAHQVMPNDCSRIGCINTVEDLVANFHCDRQFETNLSDIDFHFQPWRYFLFDREGTILAAHYRVADKSMTQVIKTEKNTSSEGRCSPVDTNNCRTYFIYSNPIFFVVLPRLFYSISFLRHLAWLHEYATREAQHYFWKPLPFCTYDHIDSILQDFSEKVRHVDCYEYNVQTFIEYQ